MLVTSLLCSLFVLRLRQRFHVDEELERTGCLQSEYPLDVDTCSSS
jgi:hypothetical protein